MHTQQTTNMKKPFEYSQEFRNNGKDLRSIDKSLRERERERKWKKTDCHNL